MIRARRYFVEKASVFGPFAAMKKTHSLPEMGNRYLGEYCDAYTIVGMPAALESGELERL
jgi:hypothetical protein